MIFQLSRMDSHGFKAEFGQGLMKPSDVREALRFAAEGRTSDAFVAPEVLNEVRKAMSAPKCQAVLR
ncbi:MAG: hypothetical protein ACK5Y2_10675 [Bdellovibrionales bacterium]